MDMRRIEIVVGAFVVTGIAALVTLALKVSSLNSLPGEATYTINAKFEDIGGLKVRSPVKIGGVVVGRVSNIDLESDTMTPRIQMAINKKYNQLPVDTSAKIDTAGLLGEQFVQLSVGGEDDLLADGDSLTMTQPSVSFLGVLSKYMFSEGSKPNTTEGAQ
jgi:phospholipid/cholesterol/gamma-HCH transport system substrate-binding protein